MNSKGLIPGFRFLRCKVARKSGSDRREGQLIGGDGPVLSCTEAAIQSLKFGLTTEFETLSATNQNHSHYSDIWGHSRARSDIDEAQRRTDTPKLGTYLIGVGPSTALTTNLCLKSFLEYVEKWHYGLASLDII